MTDDKFVVYHNKKPVYQLNEKLAQKQGCTDQEIINLVNLHQYKLSVFDLMEATDDVAELRRLADIVKSIEFELQKNWHFPQNADFHEWYRVPKCTCPVMDNADLRGTKYRIYAPNCPIHGDRGYEESDNNTAPVDQH